MKRIIMAIVLVITMMHTSGCASEPTTVTVTIKNMTQYELETVIFQIPPTKGSTSPMHDIVTDQDAPLLPGEEREASVSIFQRDLGNNGCAVILIKDDETKYGEESTVILKKGANKFEITSTQTTKIVVNAVD